jgi:hypothetical protein
MGHTPEQRDEHPLCGAKKKNGETCRAFAGQGTEHGGSGKCRWHLGNSRNHKQAAVVSEAKRRMVKLGPAIAVQPHEALLWLLHAGSGHVAYLGQEIAAMDDLGTFEGQVLVQLYGEERDRLAKVAEVCIRAGVTEEQVRLAERFGDAIARVVGSALDAVKDLTEEQRRAFAETFRLELLALEPSADEPVVLDAPARAAS